MLVGKADRSRKSAENRVRTGERNRRFSLARFFAAFLSLLVRFFRSSTLTESTLTQSQAQAMYCEVFLRPGSFLGKQDDSKGSARLNFIFFSFILSYFLHFLFKEMLSFFPQKIKFVPTTLYTCFASRRWVPIYYL